MRPSKNTKYLSVLPTFTLVFCILLKTVYSEVNDISCRKCVDPEGSSCDDLIGGFSSSKFWIMRDDKRGTFYDAVETCQRFGFTIAEINSESEQSTFRKLVASGNKYWIGFIKQESDDRLIKMDLATPLPFQPQGIEDDCQDQHVGIKGVSVDSEGMWHASNVDEMFHIVCQFPSTSPCSSHKENESVYGITEKGCSQPEFEDTQLIRISPTSKFLYPKHLLFTSSVEASELCNKLGLEPATIDGSWEYKHLVNFVYDRNLNNSKNNFKVNLGAIQSESGIFQNMNRKPHSNSNSLFFQAFKFDLDEDYFADEADCLAIEWYDTEHYFVPISCDSKAEVMPLCQYKPEESCSTFTESPLSFQDKSGRLDMMFKLGEYERNVFYGSMTQKTWQEAERTCRTNGLGLLSFPRRNKGGQEGWKQKMRVIKTYRERLGISNWAGMSWNSAGYFTDNKNFVLESNTSHDLQEDDKKGEICPLFTFSGIIPVLCKLPNFFICYGLKNQSTKLIDVSTSTRVKRDADLKKWTRAADEDHVECENITTLLTLSFSSGGLTNEEMIGLMKAKASLNFIKGLSKDLPIKENSTWRIHQVKGMGELTKFICPKEYVRPDFINILLNFIMVYYNNIEENELPPKREKFWNNLKSMYSECKENSQPLTFSSAGGLITEFGTDEDKGSVFIVNEKADNYPVLDYMLEGLWYMFELTAATCYKSAGSTILWFSEFFYYFRKDFTNQLKQWWINPGETNYGLLFGDMDLYENLYNLRACSVATFQRSDIQDILLVRPVDVGDDGEHFAQNLNQRT